MTVYMKDYEVETKEGQVTYIDITKKVRYSIESSGISKGICIVTTNHTTCSIFFEEFTHDIDENGTDFLLLDMDECLQKIIPNHESSEIYRYPGDEHYHQVKSWKNHEQWLPNGDRSKLWNADAHIKSSIIGSSETFVVKNNELFVGITGYIYFVDFDRTRERKRKFTVTVIGE
ncbi:YjbQ family protein [Helcococcus ovis]|uniref:YjbQ family protein n=3 Tax=Helcococcus ovis TaxID=72026 RepID=A0A4R9C2C5_9FIRM|nr:YjbQ family protein [Helcococcus ovis]TFF64052.1 YjbQ family protein [Helcococcus ovis]TFF65803.1 YjbQ family protein [Helcococcus ovis]TFF68901.1 YjbQ family protein [Helcococcus ovis]WNZ00669.1 YjbQ family protein [Helcococcus ovis]